MLVMSTPQEGQHHDLFQIKELFEEICQLLKEAGIDLDGLFLNADHSLTVRVLNGFVRQKISFPIQAKSSQ